MSTWIFRVIRWIVGLLVAVILLGICALLIAGRLGVFDGYDSCIPAGHVEVVDELHEGDQTLYLIYRIVGFRKYVQFYELHATLPSFGYCADPKDEPLDTDVIDDSEGMLIKDVLVHDTKQHGLRLEIRYTRQADEGVSPNQAKLIRGDPSAYESDCETRFPADRVEVVDELRTDDQTLYLVYRMSGFRTRDYELYATLPSFDVCGDPKYEWLDIDAIKDDGDRWVKDVLVRNTKKHGPMLEIRYTHQADEGVSLNQAKLIRADGLELNPEDHPRLWDAENTMETGEGILKKGHD